MILSIFSCACWPSVCFLWRNVCLGLLPIFDWVIFIYIKVYKLFVYFVYLYILETNPFPVVFFGNTFSHSVECVFTLFMICFAVQKPLSLIISHLLILFLFYCSAKWIKKDIAEIYVKECPAYVFL